MFKKILNIAHFFFVVSLNILLFHCTSVLGMTGRGYPGYIRS